MGGNIFFFFVYCGQSGRVGVLLVSPSGTKAVRKLQKWPIHPTHPPPVRRIGFDVKLQFGLKTNILHAILNKTSHKA